jgi:hypothetical protein
MLTERHAKSQQSPISEATMGLFALPDTYNRTFGTRRNVALLVYWCLSLVTSLISFSMLVCAPDFKKFSTESNE